METPAELALMQQRYYDPMLGRFLSVDPVTADGNTGGNFNRYKYANNNPYKFIDPDGRMGQLANENSEPETPEEERPDPLKRPPSPAGEIMIRMLAGSAAANEVMKSTHPSKIKQEDANKLYVQTKAAVTVGATSAATVPAAIILGGEAAAAVSPVVAAAIRSPTAREVVYHVCVGAGICQGVRPPTLTRVKQEREISQAREGMTRESRTGTQVQTYSP